MDIKKLEYFESVSRLKSFTRAAEELHIAQPSITAAIGKLEEELGVALFTRNSRKVGLTFEGELFRKKTVYLLKIYNETIEEMQMLGSKASQVLNLGVPPIIGAQITPLLYGEFLTEHPEVKLNMFEDGTLGILDALKNDKVEIGYLVLGSNIESKYNVYPMVSGEINVLMNTDNPLAKLEKVPIERLKDVKIIQLPEHTFVRRKIDEEFIRVGVEPDILTVPSQMTTTINLVSRNLGISFILGANSNIITERKTLTVRPLEKAINFKTGFVWMKERKLSSAAQKCMRYVKDKEL
jgi:Transcriptional regulator